MVSSGLQTPLHFDFLRRLQFFMCANKQRDGQCRQCKNQSHHDGRGREQLRTVIFYVPDILFAVSEGPYDDKTKLISAHGIRLFRFQLSGYYLIIYPSSTATFRNSASGRNQCCEALGTQVELKLNSMPYLHGV